MESADDAPGADFRAALRSFIEEHGEKQRLTGRARLALTYAQQEAQRRGQRFLGPEHLLLGVIRDGSSVAGVALRNLGVPPEPIREALEVLLARDVGPDRSGLQPETRAALERASGEAQRLGHRHIGTEHLLLGLAWEESGDAARILASFGVTLDRARAEVLLALEGWQEGRRGDDHQCGLHVAGAGASIRLSGEV